jgi:hypothetical protein
MNGPEEYYGLPLCTRVGACRLRIENEWCTVSEQVLEGHSRWRVRGENGRLLGSGRSAAGAIRTARATLQGERG